jgi:hypothetical protein
MPALALVEVAEGGVAVGLVADDEHRHRGGVDAGDRADAGMLLGAAHPHLAGLDRPLRLRDVRGQALVDGGVEHRAALTAGVLVPLEGRARGEDRRRRHVGDDVPGRRDVDEDRLGAGQPGQRLGVGRPPPFLDLRGEVEDGGLLLDGHRGLRSAAGRCGSPSR